jgi:hypothetical protein
VGIIWVILVIRLDGLLIDDCTVIFLGCLRIQNTERKKEVCDGFLLELNSLLILQLENHEWSACSRRVIMLFVISFGCP